MFDSKCSTDDAARQAVAQDPEVVQFEREAARIAEGYLASLRELGKAHRRERYIDWFFCGDDERFFALMAEEYALRGEPEPAELDAGAEREIIGQRFDRLSNDEIRAFEAMVRCENSDWYFDDFFWSDEVRAARNALGDAVRKIVEQAESSARARYLSDMEDLEDEAEYEQARARHERVKTELHWVSMLYCPVLYNCDACGKTMHSHDEVGELIGEVGLWAMPNGDTGSYMVCESCIAKPETHEALTRLFDESAAYHTAKDETIELFVAAVVEKSYEKLTPEERAELERQSEEYVKARMVVLVQEYRDARDEAEQAAADNSGQQGPQGSTAGQGAQNGPQPSQAGPQPQPSVSLAQRYNVRGLRDAYQARPPINYLVDKIIAAPSLNIFYGAPGTLKSMILLDMAADVASGQMWLEPIPHTNKAAARGIATKQAAALWIDLDNGKRRTDERVEAFCRARKLPEDTPIHYISMPDPWIDGSDDAKCAEITELIKELGATLVVIDNLGLVTGDTDEISAGMANVMGNFRKMAEDSGAAIILIHHQRKSNGTTGRKGETLRGHSSIEASLDLAICIEREEGKPEIVLIPTKVRDFDVPTFGAYFAYTHKPGTTELETARFYGQEAENAKQKQQRQIETAVLMELQAMINNGDPAPNQKQLKEAVRDRLTLDGLPIGLTKINAVITDMVRQGKIIETGAARNTKVYTMAHSTP